MNKRENGITYRQVDKSWFAAYDAIPMRVNVKRIYRLVRVDQGLGGLMLQEEAVDGYIKDLGVYEEATRYEEQFDITNWVFYMAFAGDKPIGAVTVAAQTENVNMLEGRSDLSVLWDLRVDDAYKGRGVGTQLFQLAAEWSRSKGFTQLKIECQNNNVPACHFYQKQGAVIGKIDAYAYWHDPAVRDEVQLIWYLTL
jgi:GNAT superfamily N-acetyltransferase